MIKARNIPPSNAPRATPSHRGGSGIGNGLSACSSIYPLVLVDSNLYDFICLVGWLCWGWNPAGWLGFNYDLVEEVWVNLENSVANFFC
jgi:hypothetical protein